MPKNGEEPNIKIRISQRGSGRGGDDEDNNNKKKNDYELIIFKSLTHFTMDDGAEL